MVEHPVLSRHDALALAQAARLIEQAQQAPSDDPSAVVAALTHTVAVWQWIGAALAQASGRVPEAVEANLDKLGASVIAAAVGWAAAPNAATCARLITINRQVCAGLLAGQAGPLA
jgi:flagellar biosynthesis regulator FlaF